MADLKASYDLSSGDTRSSVISGGTYLNLQAFLTTVAGRVSYFVEIRNSSTGDWDSLRDNGKPIVFHTLNSVEAQEAILLTGGAVEYSINIKPGDNTTGTLTLDGITDGTIA